MKTLNSIAQREIPVGSPFTGIGPLGEDIGTGSKRFTDVLSGAIGLVTAIAAIWFVFLLLIGAIGLMTAGDDKSAVEGARKKITMGFVGIFVVIAGIFIADLVGNLLGIDILNPAEFIDNFWKNL